MRLSLSNSVVVAMVVTALAAPCLAQTDRPPEAGPTSPSEASAWPLETVTTKDGRTYRGLILDDRRPRTIEFVEIRRPPGKPMALVVRPIEKSIIVDTERVDADEREKLLTRIERFKSHAQIEAQQIRAVQLEELAEGTSKQWRYEGPWFSLISSTDPDTARLLVVRLEQMFRAFLQIVPPRSSTAGASLRFQIFGSRDEYFNAIRRQGLEIRNPAYFDLDANLIVAGGDLRQLTQDAAEWQRERDALLTELEQLDRKMPQRLEKLRRELESQGMTAEQLDKIEGATQIRWIEQRQRLERYLAAAERRNAALRSQRMDGTLRRLYHEAFHAYLENYVFNDAEYDVPRWLNEGLAQVFEAGLLEDDVLRLDAPDAAMLARLQDDLRTQTPRPLLDVISAAQDSFLIPHGLPDGAASRNYLYSWGLAHYLAFNQRIIGSTSLGTYVSTDAAQLAPRARFEQLTGMPLDEFETRWRRDMLALPTRPGASKKRTDSASPDAGGPAQ